MKRAVLSKVTDLKVVAVAAPPLILASGSPRRRELLTAAGLQFEIVSPGVSEVDSSSLSIAELTTCNATRKAIAVARRHQHSIVLGADTLVALNGEVITKPRDLDEAIRILHRLRGKEHQVCTSVFVCAAAQGMMVSFRVISHVQFRRLSDQKIFAYLAKINPLDKAGAYAAQGHGAEIIRRIRGSYTNVVGLPMNETLHVLAGFGITSRRPADSKSPACFRPDLRRRTRSS